MLSAPSPMLALVSVRGTTKSQPILALASQGKAHLDYLVFTTEFGEGTNVTVISTTASNSKRSILDPSIRRRRAWPPPPSPAPLISCSCFPRSTDARLHGGVLDRGKKQDAAAAYAGAGGRHWILLSAVPLLLALPRDRLARLVACSALPLSIEKHTHARSSAPRSRATSTEAKSNTLSSPYGGLGEESPRGVVACGEAEYSTLMLALARPTTSDLDWHYYFQPPYDGLEEAKDIDSRPHGGEPPEVKNKTLAPHATALEKRKVVHSRFARLDLGRPTTASGGSPTDA
ncbi:hypothetical protein QFC22_006490 [Naganishia vaughanmartiniae]|uniref:Uncharacterized protein n=1 Tax=Naganishia vaughanmartiniae TaxID=1424756 RepID=A0ACC2WM37_9TREE|nr:hypothetical protein QFC22_006490 [Naganishia vaughanmartiniae]